MILRRYGTSYQSVEPNFNPTAITEIGFQRDHAFSIPVEAFEHGYEEVERGSFGAEANGEVQRDVEAEVLTNLETTLAAWVDRLDDGQVLVVLNGRDDWPKTRERRETVVEDGENRYRFHWWVDPLLAVAIYTRA